VAVAMVVAAALALWRLKWGVIRVIAAAAATGLVLRYLSWA
jgi:chromate transporter